MHTIESSTVLKEFYSTFDTIKKEIKSRQNNTLLQNQVREYLGDDFPEWLDPNKRYAFFFRSIHTPNQEHLFFEDIVKEFDLTPIYCNYASGKLVMKNSEKYHLARLGFLKGLNKNYEVMYSYKNLVNANAYEGKNLKDVKTLNGENLVEFHAGLFQKMEMNKNFFDFSDWFNKIRLCKDGYYAKFLTLFITQGVLFDNFLLEDAQEREFFYEKVLPSFEFVSKKFNVKPLIFPVLPIREENTPYFFFYKDEIKNIIKTHEKSI